MSPRLFPLAAWAALPAVAFAGIYGDLPDARHAWAVHDQNRPNPTKVEPGAYGTQAAPSDAIVLFDGTAASLAANWSDARGSNTLWKLGSEGDFYCVPQWKNGGGIYTRRAFGDCQLHLEFRHEPEPYRGQGAQMNGNSGVFLMGNYEIQVLESYFTDPKLAGRPEFIANYADGQAGAVYAENPPMVNPARRPGQWQTYDIVFHQPVWKGRNLVHPGSVTLFFNGVLVQDHWEMEGLTTHAKRRPLAPHAPTGRLFFQDHGCTVHFRNIWLRELPSRWANVTHSEMSADLDEVRALRQRTAAALFAKIEKPIRPTIANMQAVGEVIGYSREGEYEKAWVKIAGEMHDWLDKATDAELNAKKRELLSLRRSLDTLIRAGVVSQGCGTRARISAIALRLKWEK